MAINIKPHPYKIVCDMCGSRDTYTIERHGIPAHQQPTLCKADIIGIVNAGMEYFKDEIKSPVPDDYEQLKAEADGLKKEIERLNMELEAGTAEINRLTVELEASSTEINRLNVELRAAKQTNTSGAKPTTAKKGGKKK
jgi:hypothetical protein